MIPKQLQYGSKVHGAPARSIKTNIQPQTGTTFALGSTIIFNIPTRPNLVMVPSESFLRFTLMAMTATADATSIRMDSCGAHGLIQRIRVFHGSNLLEDIDNVGMLAKILFDLQVSTSQSYGKYSITSGTRSDLVTDLSVITAPVSASDLDTAGHTKTYIDNILRQQVKTKFINSGQIIAKSDGAPTLSNTNTTLTYTYSLNLISLIGSLCPQYLPLFAMQSSPLRVEITLVDALIKAFAIVGAVPTVTPGVVNNVEFVAQMIELSDQAMMAVNENLQGQPLQFVFPDYRNFQNTFTAVTGGSVNLPISAKYTSLKSLFLAQRDQSTGALTYFPYSSVKNGVSSYYFRLGPTVVPAIAPANTSEIFSEVLKAIGSVSDLNHHPSIDKDSFELNASVANTAALELYGASNTQSGSFYIGLDVENFAGASKDSYFAGWNSNTDDIYAVINHGTIVTAAMRSDCFALFDSLLVCENSTAYVRF